MLFHANVLTERVMKNKGSTGCNRQSLHLINRAIWVANGLNSFIVAPVAQKVKVNNEVYNLSEKSQPIR